MFTGIITDIGTIESIEHRGDLRVKIATAFDTSDIDLGASIACSGACMTVVDLGPHWFSADVSGESVACTAPGQWETGRRLNLERALKVGDELGGHIVTGHVDGIATVVSIEPEGDSRKIRFLAPAELAPYIASKGSITLDGISLTVNDIADQADKSLIFSVNVIPHTAQHTTFNELTENRPVNLEIDVLARYLKRMNDIRM